MAGEQFLSDRVTLYHGDSRDVLKTLADSSVDSVVTDPPYALVSIVKRFGGASAAPVNNANTKAGRQDPYASTARGFMGKAWDTGETAFAVEFWAEVMRVLKPGGHVIAASGTRTYHRLAVAIEDSGFEIRDQILWLYGSGFPKSHDVGKDHVASKAAGRRVVLQAFEGHGQSEGWGTALKPACEPMVLARKPLAGTVAGNVLAHGTGALNIGDCRIGDEVRLAAFSSLAPCSGNKLGEAGTAEARRGTQGEAKEYVGRWPANVIHDDSAEVVEAFDLAGTRSAGNHPSQRRGIGFTEASGGINSGTIGERRQTESGSAARFFYSAKADARDRVGSEHPTVKPVDLMQYLCRLVTPPGGVVLDPFAGSGTTGEAAWRDGFRAILIEREAEYVEDIRRRLALANAGNDERKVAIAKHKGAAEPGPLFSLLGDPSA